MFSSYFLGSLARSQSLSRSPRHNKGKIYKIIYKIIAFSLLATNVANAEKQNLGQFAIDEVVKNIIELPQKAATDGVRSVNKSIGKELFKSEGSGKIEIKNGNLKIDTKNEKSLELAAEFRKNYKKPPQCVEPATEKIRIKCANEYINARQAEINQ